MVKDSHLIIELAPPYPNGKPHLGHILEATIANYLRKLTNPFFFEQYLERHKLLFEPVQFKDPKTTLTYGVDPNGLPLYLKVKTQNPSASNAQLLTLCEDAVERGTKDFLQFYNNIGISDSTFYTTNDSLHTQKSKQLFQEFLEKGFIRKIKKPGLYCSKCKTMLARSQCDYEELTDASYHLKAKSNTGELFYIMTTKPECFFAARKVFKHPEDKRYENLETVSLELDKHNSVVLPVETSTLVNINKGTGLTYVASYTSELDIELLRGQEYPSFFNEQGLVQLGLKECDFIQPVAYDSYKARFLKKFNLIPVLITAKKLLHTQRSSCKAEVIFVVSDQLVIPCKEFREELLTALHNLTVNDRNALNELKKYIPKLEDWCVSRNPNTYGIRVVYEGEQLVLDTWFTSALIPYITKEPRVRIQGTDILRTWLLYSLILGVLLKRCNYESKGIEKVLLHRMVVDENRQKFSKSTGSSFEWTQLASSRKLSIKAYFISQRLDKEIIFSEFNINKTDKLLRKIHNTKNFFENHVPEYYKENCSKEVISKKVRQLVENLVHDAHHLKLNPDLTKIYQLSKQMIEKIRNQTLTIAQYELASAKVFSLDYVIQCL